MVGSVPESYKWHVIFDTSVVKEVDTGILEELNNRGIRVNFWRGETGDFGHQLLNQALDNIDDGWIYFLDDDNILHENFEQTVQQTIEENPVCEAIIFDQEVNGKDFSGVDIRKAMAANVEVSKIDIAQYTIKRSLIGSTRFRKFDYKADGHFVTEIFNSNQSKFIFVNQTLSYYNFLSDDKQSSIPRILIVGDQSCLQLETEHISDYKCRDLNVLRIDDDSYIDRILNQFDPDSIITCGEDWKQHQELANKCSNIRRKWLHLGTIDDASGQKVYNNCMQYILSSDQVNPTISFFTSAYNIGNDINVAYQSLLHQTYTNWEWIVVDDSTDYGRTREIIQDIRNKDHRVKLHSFRERSNGIIGEAKYRAASLCTGKWIVELDHDDFLTHDAAEWIIKASSKHPECKFIYSDCAEVRKIDGQSLTYPDGFVFGYGSYRIESYDGINYSVMNSVNINPKTIRHIVGVPNHLRAWDRIFYHTIGGHNRRLTIADDYELLIRTFLNTIMLRVPKFLYVQYLHPNNTHVQEQTRADIQRRIRTISAYYNQHINSRFTELGLNDWAYNFDKHNPILAPSMFGNDENAANRIMKL
jgi:glycosyltransferase involved in cell wall biosynthesis